MRRAILIVLGIIWLIPTYLIVVNASRPADDFHAEDVWTPDGFALFENFAIAWDRADIGASLISTLIYSTISPAIAAIVGALAGYAIVVLRLRHGFWWFILIFAGTIFPNQMLLVPLFIGFSDTGFYDTQFGMVLVYTAVLVPFAAFVMRNFFTGVAFSIFEAARMDGAGTFRIFWRIHLPLAIPAMVAIFILEFTLTWNDLLFGVTLSQSENIRPVMTVLAQLSTDVRAGIPIPVALAAGLVVSLPTVVVFLATQRLFARGMTLGDIS